ncbi:MAG: hypothetical protein HYX55_07130 [Chloroflexi bacterium]|nr:hypothetical protein [Chloroflexota bacterium]
MDRTAGGAPRHHPRSRHGLSAEQESVLELQRLAGNSAVTRALEAGRSSGRVTSVDAVEITRQGMAPEMGLQQLREHATNKQSLALTRRSILDEPPMMRPEPADKVKDGYRTKAQKVRSIPEPEIEEWWPKEGFHKLLDGSYLEVDHDWEERLEKGEDEHRDDARLAWEKTWKKVQETINQFADKPGPPEATPEAAKKALWKRYVKALPKDLQPEGDTPSDSKQRDVLSVRPGTFMGWMWEITVVRDTRNYHETTTVARSLSSTKTPPRDASVVGIGKHKDFQIKGPESEALIEEVRKNYTPGRSIIGSKLKDDGTAGNATK